MTLGKYLKYKDSGVEWIREIPEGWEVMRLKDGAVLNSESLSEDENSDIVINYIDISAVETRGLVAEPLQMEYKNAPSRARRIIKVGDTIVSTVRPNLQALAFFDKVGTNYIASTGFTTLSPKKKIEPKLLYYFVKSHYFCSQMVSRAVGVGYPATGEKDLAVIPICVPPISQQSQMIQYLDANSVKLQQIIDFKRHQIELLQEHEKSLIHNAVTKGLDPKAKMKDSGVEWIGVIPEGWKIKKLQDSASNEKNSFVDGPFGSDLKNEEYVDEGIPLIQLNNVGIGYHDLSNLKFITEKKYAELIRHSALSGDIVIAKMADPVARATIISNKWGKYTIVADCVKLTVNNRYNPTFLIYILNSYIRAEAELKSGGTTRLRINLNKIKKLRLAFPLKDEQNKIVSYLDSQTSTLHKAINNLENQIEKLEEYKKSMIYEVVTGKVRVE